MIAYDSAAHSRVACYVSSNFTILAAGKRTRPGKHPAHSPGDEVITTLATVMLPSNRTRALVAENSLLSDHCGTMQEVTVLLVIRYQLRAVVPKAALLTALRRL